MDVRPVVNRCPMWSAAPRADFRSMKRSRTTRAALSAFAALAATAAISAPAQAGVLPKTATDCGTPTLAQAFKPWGDSSQYKLVDGGGFEDGTEGWVLTGGAHVVSGNASSQIGASDAGAVPLAPAGWSATTPPVCVGLSEPTLRYFARKNSGL